MKIIEKEKSVKKETIKSIRDLVSSENFLYRLSDEDLFDNNLNKKYNTDNTLQLVHILYKKEIDYKSVHFLTFYTLFNEIVQNVIKKDVELLRMKVNLLFPKQGKKYNGFHTDYKDLKKFKSLIYYINDSDGDTLIYNKKLTKVKPKSGKVVLFDGNLLHASSNPIKSKMRLVCNINYIEKEND